jgi:hypothetical protein
MRKDVDLEREMRREGERREEKGREERGGEGCGGRNFGGMGPFDDLWWERRRGWGRMMRGEEEKG